MFNKLRDKVLTIKEAIGIEIVLQNKNEFYIQACHVKLEKNKVVKLKESLQLSLADYKKEFNQKLPVAVSISGKGILFKSIPKSEPTTNPIEYILPAGNPDEFYVDQLELADSKFVMVARKEIDEILNAFLNDKINILSAVFSPINILSINKLITFEDAFEIKTATFNIYYNSHSEIISISGSPRNSMTSDQDEILVGDQYVYTQSAIAFASALSLLINDVNSLESFPSKLITTSRENFIGNRYLKSGVMVSITALILILLINFICFSYYFNRNTELHFERSLIKNKMDKLNTLSASVNFKENFLKASGWNKQARLSFFADRIASIVPDSLLLNTLKIYPLNSSDIYEYSPIRFKNDTIYVTGICYEPLSFDQFSKDLSDLKLFREVNVKGYIQNRETNKSNFTLELISK